jgi:hypothetical protein
MKKEILNLIDSYWKFDDQHPISSWHDKQDLLKAAEESLNKNEEDIRNKLTPFKNLLAIIKLGLVKGESEMNDLVLKEIEECQKSIEYLSNK